MSPHFISSMFDESINLQFVSQVGSSNSNFIEDETNFWLSGYFVIKLVGSLIVADL